jgi:hypothetical protein
VRLERDGLIKWLGGRSEGFSQQHGEDGVNQAAGKRERLGRAGVAGERLEREGAVGTRWQWLGRVSAAGERLESGWDAREPSCATKLTLALSLPSPPAAQLTLSLALSLMPLVLSSLSLH